MTPDAVRYTTGTSPHEMIVASWARFALVAVQRGNRDGFRLAFLQLLDLEDREKLSAFGLAAQIWAEELRHHLVGHKCGAPLSAGVTVIRGLGNKEGEQWVLGSATADTELAPHVLLASKLIEASLEGEGERFSRLWHAAADARDGVLSNAMIALVHIVANTMRSTPSGCCAHDD